MAGVRAVSVCNVIVVFLLFFLKENLLKANRSA